MNEHRHIIIEGEELYHYGVKGMKWKDHVYAVAEKARDVAETSAKKVASAASKFAKKANEMKERLTPAARVSRGKVRAALKRRAKKYADAAKNMKNAIQDAKFKSMKKRTEAARRKPGKAPSKDQMRKIYDARRSAALQATRENLVDMKSRGRINPSNTAEAINLMKTATGTANYNRGKSIAEEYDRYYSDAKEQKQAALAAEKRAALAAKKQKQAAVAAKARSQKVGKKKPNGR